jgi:nitrogen regulatory protein PII
MKQVIIIIRPNLYFKTKEELSKNRFFSMSTKEVLGRGKQSVNFTANDGADTRAESDVYANTLVAKKMIEMIVRDDEVDHLVEVILSVNRNHTNGDGKIFILPVEESIRIHTGERGDDALI